MTMELSEGYERKYLQQADEFLSDAKALSEEKRLKSAVDRAYYAMYWAAHGLLLYKGVRQPRTHTGLIRAFGQKTVEKGVVEKRFGRMLSRAFDLRQASTYRIDAEFEEESVERIINEAEEFIDKMKHLAGM